MHNGLVIFESNLSPTQLAELRFFNDVYELLTDAGQTSGVNISLLRVPLLQGTFALRFIEANVPAPLPDGLPHYVAKQSGAHFTANTADTLLTLVHRADGRLLWGRLLPKAGFQLRRVEEGETRPELAHILGLVAELGTNDVVLDPFAGYGGIVREIAQGFWVAEVIAVEQNEHLIPHLKSIPRIAALHGDARQLGHIHTRSIDRVITAMPWVDDQNQYHVRKLYHESLIQMHRVLHAKGIAVILTAAPFLQEIAADIRFEVVKKYSIIVDGNKAVIYKLHKIDYS